MEEADDSATIFPPPDSARDRQEDAYIPETCICVITDVKLWRRYLAFWWTHPSIVRRSSQDSAIRDHTNPFQQSVNLTLGGRRGISIRRTLRFVDQRPDPAALANFVEIQGGIMNVRKWIKCMGSSQEKSHSLQPTTWD